VDGACEASCTGTWDHIPCQGDSICVDGTESPEPSCVCSSGYYSRLATEPAPRAIPEGWSEGPAPTPPPPPPTREVTVTAAPPPPPLVFVNTTQAAPPPPPAADSFGGFTPSCTDPNGEGYPNQPVDECDPNYVEYVYFVPITQEAQVDAIKANVSSKLTKELWVDSQTKDVKVEFVVYNGNLQLFAIVNVYFEFDVAGGVSSSSSVTCLDLEVNGRKSAWSLYHLLEFATVIYVMVNGAGEIKDLYDAWKFHGSVLAYFTSVWNYFDLAQVAVFTFCGVYWFRLFLIMDTIEISNRFDWSDAVVSAGQQVTLDRDCERVDLSGSDCTPRNLLVDLITKIHVADDYFTFYKICTILNLYLSLVRIFKFARFQPQLSMVNRTLKNASEGLIHFIIMLVAVVWVTAAQLKLIYGRDLREASSYLESLNLSFKMMLGAYMDETADLNSYGGVPIWMSALYFCASDLTSLTLPHSTTKRGATSLANGMFLTPRW
jgi:hypothetical protein